MKMLNNEAYWITEVSPMRNEHSVHQYVSKPHEKICKKKRITFC